MSFKQRAPFRFVAVASALLGATVLGFQHSVSAEAATIVPYSISVAKGRTLGSGVNALSAQDNNVLTFAPASGGFTGTFLFRLSDGIGAADLESLSVHTTFRGRARSEQRWRWQILDSSTRNWVALGDNTGALNNQWVAFDFPVAGDLSRFVDAQRTVKIRYLTSTNVASSDSDYLALETDTGSSGDEGAPPASPPVDLRLTPGTAWQMQLTGNIDTSIDADVYDIDLFDVPATTISRLKAQGRSVICYFSAGSWENWRPDAAAFPESVKGRSNGWAGEKWLDARNLQVLGPIMEDRIDLAVAKGCDGIDPDNVDGYSNNTGFSINYAQQLAYNRFLANYAHSRGLIVALKNDLDQVEDLVDYFDFAVNEECFQYDECDLLLPFVRNNKAVFGIEYSGDVSRFCPTANASNFDFQKKNLDLDAWRMVCRGR